jgi:hypothetical protein
VGPLKTEDGQTVADSEGMANLLNRAFKEVFTREDTTSIHEVEDMNMDSTLETVRFTEREICRKIQKPPIRSHLWTRRNWPENSPGTT